MNALLQVARNASPYLAIELLLPGGSVIALLLWIFRHRLKKEASLVKLRPWRVVMKTILKRIETIRDYAVPAGALVPTVLLVLAAGVSLSTDSSIAAPTVSLPIQVAASEV